MNILAGYRWSRKTVLQCFHLGGCTLAILSSIGFYAAEKKRNDRKETDINQITLRKYLQEI